MTIQGLYVPTEGDARVEEFPEGSGNLKRLQTLVEGTIEGISGSGFYAYGNDEAKLIGMEINRPATRLACTHGWIACGHDLLAGPIVFFGTGDGQGNDTSVSQQLVNDAVRLGLLSDF